MDNCSKTWSILIIYIRKQILKINFNQIELNKNLNVNNYTYFISYNVIRKIFFFFLKLELKVEKIDKEFEILQQEKFLFFEVNLISKTTYDEKVIKLAYMIVLNFLFISF